MTDVPDLDTVLQSLRELIDEQDIDADTPLAHLNVDSLDLLEWLQQLEHRHQLRLSEQFISTVSAGQSVAQIHRMLVERQPG